MLVLHNCADKCRILLVRNAFASDIAPQIPSRPVLINLGKVVCKNVNCLQRISMGFSVVLSVFLMFSFFLLVEKPLQTFILGPKLLVSSNHLLFCLCSDFS